jgi:hypothetical protein
MKAYFFDVEDMGATVTEKDIPEQWPRRPPSGATR